MPDPQLIRGRYVYRLNGEPAPIEESWQRRRIDENHWEIESSRIAGDVSIRVRATSNSLGVRECRVQWRQQRDIEAHYVLSGQSLRFSIGDGAGQSAVQDIALERQPAMLFPLMRIFAGPVIARLLATGAQGLVVLPELGVPEDDDQLLRPRLSERSARLVGNEVLDVAGMGLQSCQCCQYLGDQYDDAARFWLGSDKLLLRYQWQQSPSQAWDVSLQLDESSPSS